MNPCGTSGDQHPAGGINWASDNWEPHPSGVICNFQDFGGHFQTNRPDQWGWDNSMVFTLNQTASSSHQGNNIEHKPTIFASSPGTDSRHFNGSFPFPFPSSSNSFPQNTPLNVWNQMGSVHNFGNFESMQNIPTTQLFHSGQLASGISGLAATNAMTNMRSSDQRHHFLDIVDFEQKNIGELFPGRIGLNLAMGGRTYFSAEDSAAARLAKRPRSSSPAHHVQIPMCQAEGCTSDLSRSKLYHRRHRVCELHSKAASVMAKAQTQRFCQQCSRFHVLSEFDEAKRSCRKRLADHNRRRRKPQPSMIISDESPLAQFLTLKSEEHNLFQSSKPITADTTSTIQLHLKKTSSPSASTRELNDQIRSSSFRPLPSLNASSSCFGRSGDEKPISVSKHSFLGSNNRTGIIQTSDSHELLIYNEAARNYESTHVHMHHGHDRSMFQHYLREIASTGPNLSLSTMPGDLGMDTRAGLRQPTNYNEEDNIAASCRKPEARLADFAAQSLRSRSCLEWMSGSISYQEQGAVDRGLNILSLSETSPSREAGARVDQSTLQQSAVALEFQEQQSDDADDVLELQQPVKFSDLQQSLRPVGSCVYD